MQAQPSIAPRRSWLSSVVVIVALMLGSGFLLAAVTDDEADSDCGGG